MWSSFCVHFDGSVFLELEDMKKVRFRTVRELYGGTEEEEGLVPTKACACAASASLCLSVSLSLFLCVVCLSLVLVGVNGSFLGGIGWFYYVGLHSKL